MYKRQIVLVVGFQAEVTRLIPLYTVGVFVSFTLSQTGMVRHWNRLLRTETDHAARRRMRTKSPRDVVTVFIPEYVVGHWWEQVLHNQSALRLKSRLLFQPGVMVTSVPWQLASSERVKARRPETPPGSTRRGYEVGPADEKVTVQK